MRETNLQRDSRTLFTECFLECVEFCRVLLFLATPSLHLYMRFFPSAGSRLVKNFSVLVEKIPPGPDSQGQ